MKNVLLIFLLIFSLPQTAAALEITFEPKCVVDDSSIRLGDIAGFNEATEMTRALASLIVGQAPAPGETVSLSTRAIREYLAGSQSLPRDITWNGSPTTAVQRLGITIGAEQIQALIAEYIKNNSDNLPEAEIRFIPGSLPLPFTLPTGNLTHQITPSNPGILGSSRFSLIFRVDEEVVKNMSVRGTVEALAPVVVATGSLKRGQVLNPQNLTMAVMDLSSIRNPGFAQEDFIGKKLTRSLRAGSPILLSMVESLPIVQRGERVKIIINSGPLHLTATGLANSDGILDQMIRVRNIASNKMIYCRVAAPGLVEVML